MACCAALGDTPPGAATEGPLGCTHTHTPKQGSGEPKEEVRTHVSPWTPLQQPSLSHAHDGSGRFLALIDHVNALCYYLYCLQADRPSIPCFSKPPSEAAHLFNDVGGQGVSPEPRVGRLRARSRVGSPVSTLGLLSHLPSPSPATIQAKKCVHASANGLSTHDTVGTGIHMPRARANTRCFS